jgi:hypothetical protein
MNKKREEKYIQSNHNHEKFLFLTVLLLFAQCKMHYWWLVITWLENPLHRSKGRSPLTIFFLIRYEEVGCIHKYPMMVWTHHLSCCESSIFLFVI